MASSRKAVAKLFMVALLAGCDGGGVGGDGGSSGDAAGGDAHDVAGQDVGADAGLDASRDDVAAEIVAIPRPTGRTRFRVTIENLSGDSPLPSALAPGLFALQRERDLLFTAGEPDRGAGLEALAEDGAPEALAASIGGDPRTIEQGVFDTPAGALAPGLISPGETYAFEVTAAPEEGTLTFATMLWETNDRFIAPGGEGIELFMPDGTPHPERDVTSVLGLWDAGTEVDEAPGFGPWQGPRQLANQPGPTEGVVHPFGHGTRAIPSPVQLVSVRVQVVVGAATPAFRFTVDNVSRARSAMITPLSPVFWALHDASWRLFESGAAASPGLESLAEDDSPAALVEALYKVPGVLVAGAATTPVGSRDAGPIGPDGSFEFVVTPDAAHPFVSLACMVVSSNDAFIATQPAGVRLLNPDGTPRGSGELERELERHLTIWDAGTERNEVPGVGPNQPADQPAPNQGPSAAEEVGVARYRDATNDLAGQVGGLVAVEVKAAGGPGQFEVTVRNQSAGSSFPLTVSGVLWTLRPGGAPLFVVGEPASPGLQALAEDGRTAKWTKALVAAGAIHGVLDTPEAAQAAGPLGAGARYVQTLTASADAPWFNVLGMLQPSNDTFFALGAGGVRLLDEAGEPRSNSLIAKDIKLALAAFDAGTEANQGGAMGPDMAPQQLGANTGSSEGNGLVRVAWDPVWQLPPVRDLVRVRIQPVADGP